MTIDTDKALAVLRERVDGAFRKRYETNWEVTALRAYVAWCDAALDALLALNAVVARAGMPCVGYACGKTPPGRDTPLPLCRSHRAREAADRLTREALEEA